MRAAGGLTDSAASMRPRYSSGASAGRRGSRAAARTRSSRAYAAITARRGSGSARRSSSDSSTAAASSAASRSSSPSSPARLPASSPREPPRADGERRRRARVIEHRGPTRRRPRTAAAARPTSWPGIEPARPTASSASIGGARSQVASRRASSMPTPTSKMNDMSVLEQAPALAPAGTGVDPAAQHQQVDERDGAADQGEEIDGEEDVEQCVARRPGRVVPDRGRALRARSRRQGERDEHAERRQQSGAATRRLLSIAG